MRKLFSILFSLIIAMLLLPNFASAIECGERPTDGCEISKSTTFVKDSYNLPNGIKIIGDGVTLDCNNSILIGNISNSISEGIDISKFQARDIVVKNCIIVNYRRNAIGGRYVIHGIIRNNTIINASNGILLGGTEGTIIEQNKIFNAGISMNLRAVKSIIRDNLLFNGEDFISYGVGYYGDGIMLEGNDNIIERNKIITVVRGILLGQIFGSSNNTISDNFIYNSSSHGIDLTNSDNKDNVLLNNIICKRSYYSSIGWEWRTEEGGIWSKNVLNTGNDNYCDNYNNYNDMDAVGCRYKCSEAPQEKFQISIEVPKPNVKSAPLVPQQESIPTEEQVKKIKPEQPSGVAPVEGIPIYVVISVVAAVVAIIAVVVYRRMKTPQAPKGV